MSLFINRPFSDNIITYIYLISTKDLLAEVDELRLSIQTRREKMMNQNSDRGQVVHIAYVYILI